ncbi:MAG: SDR family oxidoreductase [Hyphomonadaceae bacterium]|nr:SDR family oxidoreductase [Hyphomonadaceae bacterium]
MATILITGANRGIGLELARQLKERGDTVIAACRKSSLELDALGVRVEAGIEVSDAASVADLAQRVKDLSLDILINNAGILRVEGIASMDFTSITQQLEVNALGPLRVTTALLPLLHEGSKVVIITSRMGSIADNGSGGFYGYRMSKAAVNAAGVSLARDLKDRGIAVGLFHPGMVATEMTGRSGIPAAESVRGIIQRIDALKLEASGRFTHAATGEELPW